MTPKELLSKVKAIFQAPAEPEAPAPVVPVEYTCEDGSMISVTQAGDAPAAGDMVTKDGAPAAAGDYKLQDGSTLVVGEGGVITEVKPVEPVTTDVTDTQAASAPASTPAPTMMAEMPKSAEEMKVLFDSFATGTPEERIARLEVVAKALMEYSFGWQLREAEEKAARDQAIAVYKQGMEAQEAKIKKQDEVINGLFELCEKLVETPTDEPRTLTGTRKEKFEKLASKEKRIEDLANVITQLKNKK